MGLGGHGMLAGGLSGTLQGELQTVSRGKAIPLSAGHPTGTQDRGRLT